MQEVIMKSESGLFLTQTEYYLLISAALLLGWFLGWVLGWFLGWFLGWVLTIWLLKLVERRKERKKALPKDKHQL